MAGQWLTITTSCQLSTTQANASDHMFGMQTITVGST
jgi:hypothetical protein